MNPMPMNSTIRTRSVGPVKVGEHEDVEQLGAGGRPKGVQALP